MKEDYGHKTGKIFQEGDLRVGVSFEVIVFLNEVHFEKKTTFQEQVEIS